MHLSVYMCRHNVYIKPIIDITSVTNQLVIDILEGNTNIQTPWIYRVVYHVYRSTNETYNEYAFKTTISVIFTKASTITSYTKVAKLWYDEAQAGGDWGCKYHEWMQV